MLERVSCEIQDLEMDLGEPFRTLLEIASLTEVVSTQVPSWRS